MNIFMLSTGCGWFVVILSLGVLSGWQFDLLILRSLIPNAPETTPLTAVLLLALGLALLIARQIVAGKLVARFVWLCWGVVAGALLAAIWTGWQDIFRLGPSIELIL